jgi:RNA polymerase sigma-70 factor, ECF subfamily
MIDFETVYQRYSRDILKFATYLCGNPVLAEDIAAETFARAWTTRQTIRSESVKAYLLTIARNLYRDHLKRRRHEVEISPQLRASTPGPEHVAVTRRQLAETLDALRILPEVDRAALLMAAEGGLTYETIARSLELTVPAVKVKIHRARLRILEWREAREEGLR